ncbi:MAG TPA: acyltransferase, partial [Gemmatimonadales bacterium]|nr:acyltransferase [Gemmatimonadales bacterium]
AKFGRFYWRRVLRIVPLYYVACAILFGVVPFLPYFRAQPEIALLHRSQPWYWAYGVNFLQVVRGEGATPFNTGHFWSLAVEEQFYLVWPLLVFALPREAFRWVVRTAIILGPLVRLACVLVLPHGTGAVATYVLPFARMDVLGVGAWVALRQHEARTGLVHPRAPSAWWPAFALAAFVALAFARGGADGYDPAFQAVGYSLVAFGAGWVVLDAVAGGGGRRRSARLLGARPLRTLGKYAYCLYVVHYPLTTVLNLFWARVPLTTVGGSLVLVWAAYGTILVAASFGIAWVSWRLLESPILAWKDRAPFAAPGLAPIAE